MIRTIIKDHGMVIKNVKEEIAKNFREWLAIRNNKGVKTQYNEATQTLTVEDTNYFTEREQAYDYLYKLI